MVYSRIKNNKKKGYEETLNMKVASIYRIKMLTLYKIDLIVKMLKCIYTVYQWFTARLQ